MPRLTRIREIDVLNGVAIVEAGCIPEGVKSVEHGIGMAKRAAFEDRVDPVARDLRVLLKGCSILKTFSVPAE